MDETKIKTTLTYKTTQTQLTKKVEQATDPDEATELICVYLHTMAKIKRPSGIFMYKNRELDSGATVRDGFFKNWRSPAITKSKWMQIRELVDRYPHRICATLMEVLMDPRLGHLDSHIKRK